MFKLLLHFEFYNTLLILIGAAVIELNDSNFHSQIHNRNLSLVIFHTSWCSRCNKLLLKLPEIDEKLQEISSKINIFKVECDANGKLTCKNYKIDGYPILKSFRGDKEYGTFEGNREVKNIVNFMEIEAAPVARRLDNFRNIEQELRGENRACLVASLHTQSKLGIIFNAIAEKMRRNTCFLYVLNELDYTWIKLYRNPQLWNTFEDIFIEYQGDEKIDSLEEFVKFNYHGLVAIRTFSNKNEFKLPLAITYFHIDYEMNPKGTKYWHNRILKIASKYRKYFNFAMSSTKEFQHELEEVGVDNIETDKPLVIVILETNEKFILRDNFTVELFDIFLHNILHKMLNPYLKSQTAPATKESRVVLAVGSTFYDLAINHANDVMVEVFAGWCDHCKTISPLFEQVADMMKNENICFIKIDATQNDVPDGYTPKRYPSFYWSTEKNRMNPIEYQGHHSIEEFVKFIARHASSDLKDYYRDGSPKTTKIEL